MSGDMRISTDGAIVGTYRSPFLNGLLTSLICCCLFQIAVNMQQSIASVANSLQNPSAEAILPRTPPRLNYLIRTGQSINLTCPYDVPFYSWIHSDQPTKILSDKHWFSIRSAFVEHSGRYVCHAVDGYGSNSADFAVKVIDPSSYSAQRECAIDSSRTANIEGPCFLNSYGDRDLNPTREWGDSVVLDCDAVTTNSAADGLQYQWEVFHSRSSVGNGVGLSQSSDDQRRLLARASALAQSPVMSSMSDHLSNSESPSHSIDLSRYTEPKLKIPNLNLKHSGEYRCAVAVVGSRRLVSSKGLLSVPGRTDVITRSFRLTVKPRSDGQVIIGPRSINETVNAGEDVVFKCEVNPEEHRSSTIRWGKGIDPTQHATYEASGREVIQWAGGTFVVLPSISSTDLHGFEKQSSMVELTGNRKLNGRGVSSSASSSGSTNGNPVMPSSGAVATDASANQISHLFVRHVRPSDAGRYVCSVLTEAGRDDHKFVHLAVVGSTEDETNEVTGAGVRRLTVYIAVPTVVFFVCLCVVTYCLVSRRASRVTRAGHRRQRNYYTPSQSQVKSPSAASSSSIGVCRNGLGSGAASWTMTTDPRLRPSPVGTGQVTAVTMGYSSTNGSGSLPGTGQLMPPGYPTTVPTSVPMVKGSYPLLLQPMEPQSNVPFYAVQNPNALSSYTQPAYQANNPVSNEYTLANHVVNGYPPGTVYQLPYGNNVIQNGPSTGPVTNPNSSSPESSAIAGPGSLLNNESLDGRLLLQVNHVGQQSIFPGFVPGIVSTGANFDYPPHGEFDVGQNKPQLLSYPSHTENSHGNAMRA